MGTYPKEGRAGAHTRTGPACSQRQIPPPAPWLQEVRGRRARQCLQDPCGQTPTSQTGKLRPGNRNQRATDTKHHDGHFMALTHFVFMTTLGRPSLPRGRACWGDRLPRHPPSWHADPRPSYDADVAREDLSPTRLSPLQGGALGAGSLRAPHSPARWHSWRPHEVAATATGCRGVVTCLHHPLPWAVATGPPTLGDPPFLPVGALMPPAPPVALSW